MPLSSGAVHEKYKVISKNLPETISKRLQALGMTQDSVIEVLNAKGNGILIVRIRGTRFALGSNITHRIEVEPVV